MQNLLFFFSLFFGFKKWDELTTDYSSSEEDEKNISEREETKSPRLTFLDEIVMAIVSLVDKYTDLMVIYVSN